MHVSMVYKFICQSRALCEQFINLFINRGPQCVNGFRFHLLIDIFRKIKRHYDNLIF